MGAFGTPVKAPAAPIWATAAFGGGERKEEKKVGAPSAPQIFQGAPAAPQMVLKT